MRLARSLLASALMLITAMLVAPMALARQLSEGTYSQLSVSPVSEQCPDCEVRIRRITPHIIELTANNGWTGFAYYMPGQDRYRGTFEWFVEEGNPYAQVLFSIELKFDGQTLTMNASSEPLKFVAIYKKAEAEPREIAL